MNVARSCKISQLYLATKYFKLRISTVIVQIKNEKEHVAELGRGRFMSSDLLSCRLPDCFESMLFSETCIFICLELAVSGVG